MNVGDEVFLQLWRLCSIGNPGGSAIRVFKHCQPAPSLIGSSTMHFLEEGGCHLLAGRRLLLESLSLLPGLDVGAPLPEAA